MRNAPSVNYLVGRSVFQAGVILLLALSSALALAGLLLLMPALSPMLSGLGAFLWLIWVGQAWRAWSRAPGGTLRWDAQGHSADRERAGMWTWQADGEPALGLQGIDWIWDAQVAVLVRPRARHRRLPWMWIEARWHPQHWSDLRRALTAHSSR